MQAEELEDRIRALRMDLSLYSREIDDYITGLYGTILSNNKYSSIDLKKDPRAIVPVLKQDMLDIVSSRKTISQFSGDEDIITSKGYLATLELVCKISEGIVKCEESISSFDLVTACSNLKDLDCAFKNIPKADSELGHYQVLQNLKKEVVTIRSRLVSKLNRILSSCVSFEHGKMSVNKEISDFFHAENQCVTKSVRLDQVLISLVDLNEIGNSLHVVFSNFWKYILFPLWKEKKSTSPKIHQSSDYSELFFDVLCRHAESVDKNSINGSVLDSSSNAVSSRFSYSQLSNGNKTASKHMLGSCKMPVPSFLDCCGHLISFFWTEVCCSLDTMKVHFCYEIFASSIESEGTHYDYPVLIECLQECIVAAIPKVESELPLYLKHVEKACKELESRWIKVMLLPFVPPRPASSPKAGTAFNGKFLASSKSFSATKNRFANIPDILSRPLSCLLDELPVYFAQSRHEDILARAREVVLADYHNSMFASGDAQEDDPSSAGSIGDARAILEQSGSLAYQPLSFEPCQISLASCRLLKLIHEVLKQVRYSSSMIADTLLLGSRDSMELFLAVISTKYSSIIHRDVRMGAVFFNDCLYLAHNATLITHTYQEDFCQVDPEFRLAMALIDFIPRLREAGGKILTHHVESQQKILNEMIESLNLQCREDGEVASEKSHHSSFSDGRFPRSDEIEHSNSTNSESGNRLGSFSFSKGPASLLRGKLQSLGGSWGSKLLSNIGSSSSSSSSSSTSAMDSEMIISPTKLTSLPNMMGGRKRKVANDEESAKQILRHLEYLKSQWQGVLQESSYNKVMGFLIDYVFQMVMNPILQANYIGEKAGSDLSKLMKILLGLANCFALEDNSVGIETIVVSWKKFLVLSDLLEYSLYDIAEWLPRKKFSCFSSQQLSSLVRALFVDNAKRQNVLNAIMEVSN